LRGHEVTLLAFDREAGIDYSSVEMFCELHTVRHSTNNSLLGVAKNIFSRLPYNISKYHSPQLARMLVDLASTHPFNVVHVDHLHMAEYGQLSKRILKIPVVLRQHNVESTIMERFAETLRNPFMRGYIGMQALRLQKYEAQMLRQFDYCCAISEPDAARILSMEPLAKIRVIPGGVEASFFEQVNSIERVPFSIVFFGGLDWIPNQDAIIWFCEKVFPSILKIRPNATFHVVGKNIPSKIRELQSEHLILHGFVSDLHREISRYELSVAPFRIGGGMRLKIVECFAMGVPVVATSVGCEGIDARNGEHLLVGNTPEELSGCVLRLFDDQELRRTLTRNAYALANRSYRWESIAAEFERTYIELIEKARERGPN